MPMQVMYLRDGFRQPVLYRGRDAFPDVQGRLPKGWCEECGTEIFDDGQRSCERCQRRRKKDATQRKSLPSLP